MEVNMSEKIKDILDRVCSFTYYGWITRREGEQIRDNINDLQQKVEQLEKENKELKQPQVFIDCENMEERYGRDLYEDYLKEKIEQLENIRKEAIKLLKKCGIVDEKGNFNAYLDTIELKDLLNILSKGSDK